MFGKIVHAENYVTKNQVLIVKPEKNIINVPYPAFTNTSLIEIENSGPFPIYAYKSITISLVIPETAVMIPEFSTFKGDMRSLGPDTAKNLMLGLMGELDKVKVKITIKRRKKAKK